MWQFESLSEATAFLGERHTSATFGVFDGIHLGHQDLIHRITQEARRGDNLAAVLTFRSHPLSLLAPVYTPARLTSPRRQADLLEGLGIDLLVTVAFDRAFADLSPREFIREVLVKGLRAQTISLGFNNRFGQGGKGDGVLLERIGDELGLGTHVVPPRIWKGSVVSSTRVRQLLLDGRIRKANALLGRPHVLEGTVTEGDRRGRSIGFPTANLRVAEGTLIPASGVYAVRAIRDGDSLDGMMNIGSRPTFEGEGTTVEVHLFDFDAELYGERLEVEMFEHLRPEQRFRSAEDLAEQLQRDREDARTVLAQEV
ncbi:bifunctional riboflavin kinase/FAD synthetase [Candidatus Sumerlaeota bacterium]|nr:bifunctional riboflavin kinase/FAD synthetase [Candidatus Sumerlaeota bacterium]